MCEHEKADAPLTVKEQTALIAKELRIDSEIEAFNEWIESVRKEGIKRISEENYIGARIVLWDERAKPLSYDEVLSTDGAVFCELNGSFDGWALVTSRDSRGVTFIFDDGDSVVFRKDEYGKYFRCWNGRPTKEDKDAAKWGEQDNVDS